MCGIYNMHLYAIICHSQKSADAGTSYTHTPFRAAPITLNLFSQILHGRYWPRPCLWAAGMERRVGGFGPFAEQLAVLVLNRLRCLCGKCISVYQSGCARVVHFLLFFHRCDVSLYVGLSGHKEAAKVWSCVEGYSHWLWKKVPTLF